jgi:hypothetical protein
MTESRRERRLRGAEEKVREYLGRYGGKLRSNRIVLDPELGEETLATHRYPDTVVVREAAAPESVIAHELVHIAQGTLEQFRGFRLLYTLLAEGLADWVAKQLYPDHEVRYEAGYRLVQLLVEVNKMVIGDLLHLNEMPLVPADLESILSSPHLSVYSRDLLSGMAGRIRDSIRAAREAGITDPTFVTLGEEVRAWKFLLDGRFERVRERIGELVEKWFGQENSS